MTLNYKDLLLNIDNYPTIRKLRYDLIKMCQEDTLKMNRRDNIKYEINYNNNEVEELYNCINKLIDERHKKWYCRKTNEDYYYRELYYIAMNSINKWIYYNIEENTYNNLLEILNNTDYDFYLSVIINNISKYVVNIKINIPEIRNILYKVRNDNYTLYYDDDNVIGDYGNYNLYDDFYKKYNELADAFYNNKYIIVSSNYNRIHEYKIANNNQTEEINERIKTDNLKKCSLWVCENNFENMFVNPDTLCSNLYIKGLNYYVKFNKYDNKTKIYTVDILLIFISHKYNTSYNFIFIAFYYYINLIISFNNIIT